jgi:hypothetical protein
LVPTPKQQYAAKLREIVRRYDAMEDETIRRILSMLKSLRKNIAAEVVEVGSWEAHRQRNLLKTVNDAIEQFQSSLSAELRSGMTTAWDIGADEALEPLQAAGITVQMSATGGVSKSQINTLLDYSVDLVKEITAEMNRKITTQIRLAGLGDKNPIEVMRAITDILGVDADYGVWAKRRDPAKGIAARAETITRTELHRVNNMSHHAQQKSIADAVGGVTKRWIATADGRTRASHLSAHMRYKDDPIPIDEAFQVGGSSLMYPGDPAGPPGQTINCRCRQSTQHPSMGNVGLNMDGLVAAEMKRRKEAGTLYAGRRFKELLAGGLDRQQAFVVAVMDGMGEIAGRKAR